MGLEFGTTGKSKTNGLQPESQLQPDAADTRLRDMQDETMEAPSATSDIRARVLCSRMCRRHPPNGVPPACNQQVAAGWDA